MDAKIYKNICEFIKKNERRYPDGIKDRSNFRKKCKKYTLGDDGCLYFRHRANSQLLIVVKEGDQKERILRQQHISDERHIGTNQMRRNILQTYFWSGLQEDIIKYIKKCSICSEKNNILKVCHNDSDFPQQDDEILPNFPIHLSSRDEKNIENSKELNDAILKCRFSWNLEILGPLSITHGGNEFVAVFTQDGTLWVEAWPLRLPSTAEIAKFVSKILFRYSFIDRIRLNKLYYDKKDFGSRLSDALNHLFGKLKPKLEEIHESEQHSNDSLIAVLIRRYASVDEFKYTWDTHLETILLAYNTFHQEKLKNSPYFLTFGCKPSLLHLEGFHDKGETEHKNLFSWTINFVRVFNPNLQTMEI